MNRQELARLYLDAELPDRGKGGYYLTNVTHPMVQALFREYRMRQGISLRYPPSDMERVEFEFSLLNREALDAIESMSRKKIELRTQLHIGEKKDALPIQR